MVPACDLNCRSAGGSRSRRDGNSRIDRQPTEKQGVSGSIALRSLGRIYSERRTRNQFEVARRLAMEFLTSCLEYSIDVWRTSYLECHLQNPLAHTVMTKMFIPLIAVFHIFSIIDGNTEKT